MSRDSVGDFLTIIRNGIIASKSSVYSSYSKMNHSIICLLKDEGFVVGYQVLGENYDAKIKIELKYVDGESAIHHIERVSSPGCRVYKKIRSVEPVIGKLGVAVLSTNKGVLSDKQAKHFSVGGELLFTVW